MDTARFVHPDAALHLAIHTVQGVPRRLAEAGRLRPSVDDQEVQSVEEEEVTVLYHVRGHHWDPDAILDEMKGLEGHQEIFETGQGSEIVHHEDRLWIGRLCL